MTEETVETSFEALLAASEPAQPTRRRAKWRIGATVRGQIVALDHEQLFVDVGAKTEAVMERANVTDADGQLTVAVGDPIEAVITSIDSGGRLTLGSRHSRHLHGQAELQDAYQQQLPVEGMVTAAVKGGLEVQIAGQRGFCPASQVDVRFVDDLTTLLNQRLSFLITKLETGRQLNVVVSRRALLEREQAARAVETRTRLAVGAVFSGRVTALRDFGAFVDLGGIEGLVHVSELAFGRVRHPSEILTLDQEVEVVVLRIDAGSDAKHADKIALSLRALTRDPWQDAEVNYPTGTITNGQVVRMEAFGAFIELAPGIEGMMHISEMGAKQRINHPNAVLTIGETVTARVLNIDPQRRRIALTRVNETGDTDAAVTNETAPASANKRPLRQANKPAPAAAPDPALGSFGELLRSQMNKRQSGGA
ncbi:S1 RNA-binding domain-containing protein [Rhodoferax sp. 4810]|uniref:S1 RNA-binding domain-containing protein n=1 Tax=Thiospirillum jenense TaxID=1653858 RepID=A0A839HG41_9GAMM|nr:S1 RNA-binding domain-containing protein [Thiospirillum jenense]MBB1076137.1 S1 RNA-binding domain-containing protein [Rhodoferax jenense]MBB1126077.1 S1 RNA-binding domain-containing protein [Thiospirillum jenense]